MVEVLVSRMREGEGGPALSSAQVGGPGVPLAVCRRPLELKTKWSSFRREGLSVWEFKSLPSLSPELLCSPCPVSAGTVPRLRSTLFLTLARTPGRSWCLHLLTQEG